MAECRMLKDVLRVTYPLAAISPTWHMRLRITEEQGSTVEEISLFAEAL